MSSPQWLFGGFRLDPDNACLWRGAQAIALTPKAFEVLHYLVTHPNRLVTKDTLLDAVWPETAISDTAHVQGGVALLGLFCWVVGEAYHTRSIPRASQTRKWCSWSP